MGDGSKDFKLIKCFNLKFMSIEAVDCSFAPEKMRIKDLKFGETHANAY